MKDVPTLQRKNLVKRSCVGDLNVSAQLGANYEFKLQTTKFNNASPDKMYAPLQPGICTLLFI